MLPSSLHAPIHRYFERLGEFLTENRDVLGESSRVKPFDVSFVHQSCDTLVVSTSLLSAHDRLPASSSSPIKTPTLPLPPSITLQLAGAPPHCADADATALGTSGLRQPHLDSQSPSSPSRPILSTISSIPPATTHAFSEFDKYKRLSWLDVLSLTIDEPTVGNPASWRSLFRSLSPDTQQQQATIDPADASSASFASCSSTSLEPEASHIEQGRIATTTGRALCGALVDVMLAIIRHRQRQGWSTAILIMSDDARRAVALGLLFIGIPTTLTDAQPVGLITFPFEAGLTYLTHEADAHDAGRINGAVPVFSDDRVCAATFVLAYTHRDPSRTYTQQCLVDARGFRRTIDSSFYEQQLWDNINMALSVNLSDDDEAVARAIIADMIDREPDSYQQFLNNSPVALNRSLHSSNGSTLPASSDTTPGEDSDEFHYDAGSSLGTIHSHFDEHGFTLSKSIEDSFDTEPNDSGDDRQDVFDRDDDDDDDDDDGDYDPTTRNGRRKASIQSSSSSSPSSPRLNHCVCRWDRCALEFYNARDLCHHIEQVHAAQQLARNPNDALACQWHKCSRSSTRFATVEALVEHCRNRHSPFECSRCGKTYQVRHMLEVHFRTVHGEELPDDSASEGHEQLQPKVKRTAARSPPQTPVASEPKPTECRWRSCNVGQHASHEELCAHVHEHIAHMVPDMTVSNRKYRFKCGWLNCIFSSKSRNDITIHVKRIHILEKKFVCAACHAGFVVESEFMQHKKLKHPPR